MPIAIVPLVAAISTSKTIALDILFSFLPTRWARGKVTVWCFHMIAPFSIATDRDCNAFPDFTVPIIAMPSRYNVGNLMQDSVANVRELIAPNVPDRNLNCFLSVITQSQTGRVLVEFKTPIRSNAMFLHESQTLFDCVGLCLRKQTLVQNRIGFDFRIGCGDHERTLHQTILRVNGFFRIL